MTASEHIIIFFTQNARKIDMAEIANHGAAELKMIEIPAGKQSADIHIGSYLGYLAGKSKCNIVIISNDTDFDNVIKFWKKELCISVSRKKKLQGTTVKKQTDTKAKPKVDKKKREAQFRSVYGQHFKKGVYKEKREKIISILVNATSRQQVNSELCKILSGENVSKIIKQFQPLLKDLP